MRDKNPQSKLRFLWVFLLLFSLVACQKESLYQDLAERDANEILVVLFKQNIDATKVRVEKAQDISYKIEVPKDQVQRARKILFDNNLPRSKQLGFSGICKDVSLIPTPEQEKCRRLLGLKGEIINSLVQVPGVIDADVVLNIPEVSIFETETQASKKPTASAVLRVRRDAAGAEITESRIQRYISNSVENLDPRDVTAIISFVESPEAVKSAQGSNPTSGKPGAAGNAKLATLAGLTLQVDSVQRFKIYAIVMLVLLMGVSAALILNVIKLTKMRQELKVSKAQLGVAELPPGAAPPLLEEGSKSSEVSVSSSEKAGRPAAS